FFLSSRRRHTRWPRDWSSDVCSSDLLAAELGRARDVLFWLLCGGFVWVVGDLFQQYAAKYVGISRGIPLSNTNQLWGLLWGILEIGRASCREGGQIAGRAATVDRETV